MVRSAMLKIVLPPLPQAARSAQGQTSIDQLEMKEIPLRRLRLQAPPRSLGEVPVVAGTNVPLFDLCLTAADSTAVESVPSAIVRRDIAR
jgi:hypothetical protein